MIRLTVDDLEGLKHQLRRVDHGSKFVNRARSVGRDVLVDIGQALSEQVGKQIFFGSVGC